jgi:hypothetical protein
MFDHSKGNKPTAPRSPAMPPVRPGLVRGTTAPGRGVDTEITRGVVDAVLLETAAMRLMRQTGRPQADLVPLLRAEMAAGKSLSDAADLVLARILSGAA